MKHFFSFFVSAAVLFCLSACSEGGSVWDSHEAWYDPDRPIQEGLADVFYVLSTNVLESFDESGDEAYRAVLAPEEVSMMDMELDYMKASFGDSLNFVAPYYHQFTMHSLSLPEGEFDAVYEDVADEVCGAFDYYMEHLNGGRPFILAGFSQGAMIVLDIVKHLPDSQKDRFVAAYMMGYRLSEEDLLDPNVRAADDADGWGEVISFNSVASPDAIWPQVASDAAACINPLNWCTDMTPAELVFDGDMASVEVDTLSNVLIVKGLDMDKYHFAPLDGYCAPGNLHHWDILFYNEAIKENAMHRAYFSR